MSEILSVRELSVAYGSSQVLFDVSLDIGRNELVAVVGRNGAGKTTTIRTRLDLAMLFITHDLRVAPQVCNHVAVMQHGRIVEYGPAREMFLAPRHEYTRALFAAAPGRGSRPARWL